MEEEEAGIENSAEPRGLGSTGLKNDLLAPVSACSNVESSGTF